MPVTVELIPDKTDGSAAASIKKSHVGNFLKFFFIDRSPFIKTNLLFLIRFRLSSDPLRIKLSKIYTCEFLYFIRKNFAKEEPINPQPPAIIIFTSVFI